MPGPAGHFGKTTVFATMQKQPGRTTGTLRTRTAGTDSYTSTSYNNIYIHPIKDITGITDPTGPTKQTTIVMYQMGESVAPEESDWIVDSSGNVWLILNVNSRLNKQSGFGVHDCVVIR